MSGNRFRPEPSRRPSVQVQLPLLDRLFDEAPERPHDPPRGTAETMTLLRQAVRRDLEMLLNARRSWRSPPPSLRELAVSPIAFGIPDVAAARFADKRERERLRGEIETTLRRFEPRFAHVQVSLVDPADTMDGTLHLHIDALLHADPAPEPVAFDTVVEHEAGRSVRAIDV
jgi:type VI secretion system protein ImpF